MQCVDGERVLHEMRLTEKIEEFEEREEGAEEERTENIVLGRPRMTIYRLFTDYLLFTDRKKRRSVRGKR